MARRYYRSRIRYVKPKRKWASNITNLSVNANVGVSGEYLLYKQLCANSVQSGTIPTPTIIKCGNFKVQGDLTYYTAASGQSLYSGRISAVAYIVYIPEGIVISGNVTATTGQGIIDAHPEWVMCWKVIDFDYGSTNTAAAFSFSSRLKRNLNSGDSIYYFVIPKAGSLESGATGNSQLRFNGAVQFWTCAN